MYQQSMDVSPQRFTQHEDKNKQFNTVKCCKVQKGKQEQIIVKNRNTTPVIKNIIAQLIICKRAGAYSKNIWYIKIFIE